MGMEHTMRVGMIVLLAACGTALSGQALVGRAKLSGTTATAAAKAGQTAATSLTKAFTKVGQTLAGPTTAAPAAAPTPAAPVESAQQQPAPAEAAALDGVAPGMTRQELVARLGKPSSAVSIPEGDRMMESLRFRLEGRRSVRIRLADGKVTAIDPVSQD
jgi:outer membrane protein assembly factor BamE (lipoprotein component of BamABCDE complex)